MTAKLQIQHISKAFGGVRALCDVTFDIDAGEIHAIVGENGAGKSTLMNILAGVHRPDEGTILLDSSAFAPRNPLEARAQGISIVFQELALFPTLTVDANLYAGKEVYQGIKLDHQAMQQSTQETIQKMEVDLHASDVVEDLSIGQRQWVEIARALTDDARIVILDEPNSALNHHETDVLFKLIERLKARGITILYISHRLEEVFRIADRITVLRDGHYINTWNAKETNTSEIVSAMVGRKTDEMFVRESTAHPKIMLEAEGVHVKDKLNPTSFKVHRGEIVGLVGLAGSGLSAIFEALFGVQPSSGRILLDGDAVQISNPTAAMANRIGMVPADRRGQGLMMNWSVLDNLTLAILPRLSKFGFIDSRASRDEGRAHVQQLKIVVDDLNKQVVYLSGGNQQKTLLARWLATQPHLLLLEDPTRGIDVGAKHEIYQIVDQIASDGVAVLFTSSEIEEVLALCDRILVFRNQQIIAEIPRSCADKSLVMEFTAGDVDLANQMLENRSEQHALNTPVNVAVTSDRVIHPADLTRQQKPWFMRLLAIREIGVLKALIVVIALFSLLTPFFFTVSNLLLISRQMAILGVIAVGMTYVLAAGEVDLSVGWIFNMVMSAMAALMVNFGVDPWLTIPVGLVLGVLLGVFNGIFAVSFQLPTIIVTLGTVTLFRGLALSFGGGHTISNLPESSFFQIGAGSFLGVPVMSIIMIIVFVFAAWLLRNSLFARHVLAMGANRQAAERVGIRTTRMRILVMAFSGLMCGIAAVLGLSFLGAADAQSGSGYELTAIAAAIIGGAKLGGGSGTIWGTLVGIALIMTIQNGLALMGLPTAWQIASTGIVIIAAVTVDYLTRSRRRTAVEHLLRV